MRRTLSLAVTSLLAVAFHAGAQRASINPSPELGVDAGLMFTLDNPKTTLFSVPIQSIRAGFFLSPAISLEPSLRLNTISGGGIPTITDYGIGLGLLYHLSTNRAANQPYIRPFIAFDGQSGGGGPSTSSFTVGGGFGVKMPINPRFATRLEANIGHISSSGTSQNVIGLLAGLSVYTR
jgi:hypothetical protein